MKIPNEISEIGLPAYGWFKVGKRCACHQNKLVSWICNGRDGGRERENSACKMQSSSLILQLWHILPGTCSGEMLQHLWIIQAPERRPLDTDPAQAWAHQSLFLKEARAVAASLWKHQHKTLLICKLKRPSSKKINSNTKWHVSFIKSASSSLHYLIVWAPLTSVKS